MNYYNENDPKAAAWLRELIRAGHIAPGVVDTRSITKIQPEELRDYIQCHFFAGIGGWSAALRLAGWGDDEPAWTGSCPCQPFSIAGKGEGASDERHLWPLWFRLIAECDPAIVFGEQVASPAALQWLDGVCADLEGAGYSCGASDLCAAGLGAPHIRQRLYWLAISKSTGRQRRHGESGYAHGWTRPGPGPERCGDFGGLVLPIITGLERYAGDGDHGHEPGRLDAQSHGSTAATGGAWDSFDILHCTDGKARRIESGTFPLAHGVSARVGRLRGYGNAIVPQLAAQFIAASREAIGGAS